MRKRIAALLATFALAFCLPICTPAAFAASAFDQGGSTMAAAGVESDITYNAGNLFAVMHPVSNTDIESDLYWVGQTLDASKVNVGTSGHGSILAAGQSITLKNVKVADSVRAAAQDIMIDHAQISNNITVAAQNISLGNDVNANGVYASARTLSISGSYQGGLLAGETVSFDGAIEGDLNIQAQQINIGKNAQVKGQLILPEGVTVNIADGAQVPNVTYSAPINTAQPTLFDDIISIVYACMAHIVLVGLFFVIIRKQLVSASIMARKRLGMMLLAGLVVFLVAPIACLLLIFPLITIPVVVLMVLVMLIIALFSIPFAGSALGMMLFKDRMNPVLAAVIGTLILTICAYLPILSFLTVIFCIIFTAGYLWMSYWDIHKTRRQERIAAQQAVMAGAVPPPPFGKASSAEAPVDVPPAPTGNPVSNVPPESYVAPPALGTPEGPGPDDPIQQQPANGDQTAGPGDSQDTMK